MLLSLQYTELIRINISEVKTLLDNVYYSISIFLSMNSITIPDIYEEDAGFWMDSFKSILEYPFFCGKTTFIVTDEDDLIIITLKIKEAIIDCISK